MSGETSFWGSYVDVHGKTDNIAYNVVVSGAYNNCYGGELDDKLTAKGWVVSLHGKSGNDTLIQNSYWAKTYGGKGDDTIIANKNGSYIYGEAGNDTITINVETSNEIDGGTGDDTYNINADDAACAIARAVQAEKLAFLTDIEGVYKDPDDKSTLISELKISDAHKLIEDGYIGGGMLPKLNNCIDAIENGVSRVHILDGRIAHCLLLEIFTNRGIGTAILGDAEEKFYHE